MSKPPKSVRLGFERDCQEIATGLLNYSTPLPAGIKDTVKFLQIKASVLAIGLVEPIVVIPSTGSQGFMVLDGRMRLEVLRDLGIYTVLCLISKDDEAYTYNKRVNRLTVIQEHRMIVKAAERGVSVQLLSGALGVTEGAIRQRFRLLDGICAEAITLLADKPATQGMFKILRQMKPFRQIDVAQAMVNLNNFTIKLALAMLQGTPAEQLKEDAAAKVQAGGASETLRRLERELAAVQSETKLLEDGYGPANLQLVIIKTYVKKLFDNAAVVRTLAKSHPEYLQQLQFIADIRQLPTE